MNIFILDNDIQQNVQYHCDKHVVKMILEYCQLLSTACHIHEIKIDGLYKKTHVNHPCAKWVCESKQNFKYLLDLTVALLDEYTYRYGKVHASSRLIPLFEFALDNIPHDIPMTSFAIVVKDSLYTNDAVQEYRNLYKTAKRDICTWKNRDTPYWFNE